MTKTIAGLHHVTAIAGDPQRNLDFYTGVLGLRFVKKTINFDDPGTYHFYFGDDAGTPGTILTFFPWQHARRGTMGAGEVTQTAFSIPRGSIGYWEKRLAAKNVEVERKEERMGVTVLLFRDPDGMQVELVEHASAPTRRAPRFADVPVEHAILGFFGVTMLERDLPRTEATLGLLGFRKIAEEGNRFRFAASGDGDAGDSVALGRYVDIVLDPAARQGRPGAGTVHHIAFRAEDYEDQKAWLATIGEHLAVSPIMERDYFRSIYFREPGGVLFELATDLPGFTVDEPLETLGEALRVPQWLDAQLVPLTERLVPVTLHKATTAHQTR
ncbi:MAG: ring-cleaving dioxygenase [Acidobacteria bacterium]|nr:ring-cleaving dioxygenase [Acidobacteriota bacterium]